jgi:hypothetical protein
MPTKTVSLEFVRKHKQLLKDAGLKSPSTMSSGELNSAIDKIIDKMKGPVATEWKRLKLKTEPSPDEKEKLSKALKKEQLKKGTIGGSAPVPKRDTMGKDSKRTYRIETDLDDEVFQDAKKTGWELYKKQGNRLFYRKTMTSAEAKKDLIWEARASYEKSSIDKKLK